MLKSKKIDITILLILHTVGLFGLLSPFRDLFLQLTPINLIISAIVLFKNQSDKSSSFYFFFIIVYVFGYLVELIGIKTGRVFGEYYYGQTLGLSLFGVPLLMGLNWLTLIYSIGVILQKTNFHFILKSLLGAFLMVFLDVFIEPVAIAFDFWIWETAAIPLQNYIAWYLFSFLFLLIFYKLKFNKKNEVALIYYLIQFAFFLILALVLN